MNGTNYLDFSKKFGTRLHCKASDDRVPVRDIKTISFCQGRVINESKSTTFSHLARDIVSLCAMLVIKLIMIYVASSVQ